MRKLTIIILCIILTLSLASCRKAPPVVEPPTSQVDKQAEFLKAAYYGKTDDVSAYIAAGVSPNIKGTIGDNDIQGTALHWAAKQGNLETVRLLLSKGAEVNSLTEPDISTPLMLAASNGHADVVGVLLEHKADVNATEAMSNTALIFAAARGHLQVVRAILNHKAWVDLSVREHVEGKTAEDWARRNGHEDIAQLLRAKATPEIVLGDVAETWFDSYKKLFIGTTFASEERTLVLVSMGEVDTLGYAIEITRIIDNATEVIVEVRFIYPEPGKPYLVEQNIPYVLTSLPTTKPVVFKPENPNLWVPTLVGVPADFRLYEESYWLEYVRDSMDSLVPRHIVLGVTPNLSDENGKIVVEGIAQVFEACVEYDFLDKTGKPYGHGYVQAATAAPDWGYFSFEVAEPTDKFSAIRVYSTSAKDGAIQDLVIIRP